MTKRKKVIKIIFIVLAAVLIVLLGIYIHHQVHLKAEAQLRLPLGQMVEVDGHNMSIYVEGTGDLSLVFMSGGGTCSPILDFKSLYLFPYHLAFSFYALYHYFFFAVIRQLNGNFLAVPWSGSAIQIEWVFLKFFDPDPIMQNRGDNLKHRLLFTRATRYKKPPHPTRPPK